MFTYCDAASFECLPSLLKLVFELSALLLMSFVGIITVKRLFARYRGEFLRAGFSGVDMGKAARPTLPEGQGVLCGVVYLSIMFLFIPVPFWNYLFGKDFHAFNQTNGDDEFRRGVLIFKSQFIHFLAGLLSICCMIFLGFADDALNLQWRHKIIFPSVASLPLLMVYLTNEGTTRIVVPIMFRGILGESVDIGILYYIYMGMLAVFCTNSINIYAGINGLEVGQSLVIACSLAVFNCLELRGQFWRVHLFSLYFLIPFLAVSWALYAVNRYPAKVFVGDTFCYFAGMTFAVVGILGHFSKTLLLFFMPQILNFIYSVPQLFGLIPCPRHRLPRFNPQDGLLYPSRVRFHPKSLSRVGQFLLNVLSKLRIVDCKQCTPFTPTVSGEDKSSSAQSIVNGLSGKQQKEENSEDVEEEIVEVNNFTLINLMLRFMGPMQEKTATERLLIFQLFCTCLAFGIRYPLAWVFYGFPNK